MGVDGQWKDWREAEDPAKQHHRAMRAGQAVAYWAHATPDAVAIRSLDGDRTFAQLNPRANQAMRALQDRGLRSGDAVALFCTNRPEFVEVWAACLRAGWRLTPINTHLGADEVSYILRDCQAKAFVVSGDLGDVAAAARDQITSPGVTPPIGLWIGEGGFDGFGDYEVALSEAEPSDPIEIDPGSFMLYTSGTTGFPKGVQKEGQSLISVNTAGYGPGTFHLVTGPLYHGGPWYLSMQNPLTHGAGIVIMRQWDAAEALALIERHAVTHTHVVPTMFHRLLALPEEMRQATDVSSLKLVIHGAAPCPVHVKAAMIEWWGPVIYEYYASTEGAGTLVTSEQWLERPGTVGKPDPPETVVVGDDDGLPLPAGSEGLLWIRAPDEEGPFRYFGDEAKTNDAFRGDYFTLGDIGYFDDDGWLFLTDRSAHLIISGGVNIYPAEVDHVLLEHPAVGDVATIGVPDAEWGESVLAVVEPQVGIEPSDELATELIAFCRDRLAHFKCPRVIDFIDHLPRGESGKVPKSALRKQYRDRV